MAGILKGSGIFFRNVLIQQALLSYGIITWDYTQSLSVCLCRLLEKKSLGKKKSQ